MTGKPVHVDAERALHHAVAIGSTIIPAGKLLKAAKLTGKAAKKVASAGISVTDRAAKKAEAKEAAELAAKARSDYKVTKHRANLVKGVNNALYVGTADSANARDLERNLRSIAKHAPAVYSDYISIATTAGHAKALKETTKMAKKGYNFSKAAKKVLNNPSVKNAGSGALKEATRALKKRRNQPMTKEDFQVVGQNAMYGALNSIVKGPKKKKVLRNHPSWYTKLGTDLVNLNFGSPDGVGPRPTVMTQGGKTILLTTDAIAEVMLTVPTSAANPFAVGAARMGNELRLHSGSNTIYQPIDLMAYLIEGRSFMAELCTWFRIIKTLNYVDPYDVDMPDKLTMMVMGGTTSARAAEVKVMKSKAASIVGRLNALAKTLGALIPINVSLMQRTEWMFSNVFVDGKEAKNSMKVFMAGTVPTAYINSSGEIEVGMRDILPFYTTSMTTDDILADFENRVAKFVTDRINMAIAGDMMKAYGAGAFWSPGLLHADDTVIPIYDEEALCQLQNSTPMLCWPTNDPGVLPYVQKVDATGQVTTHLAYNASREAAYAAETTWGPFSTRVVTTFKNKPSAGDVLEMTRLQAYATLVRQADTPVGTPTFETAYSTDLLCGTEIMISYKYITSKLLSDNNRLEAVDMNLGVQQGGALKDLMAMCWSMDDWAPALILSTAGVVGPDGVSYTVLNNLLDLSNWAKIDKVNLDSFHYIASNSLLVVDSTVEPLD